MGKVRGALMIYIVSLECSNGHHHYQNTESTKASFESDAAKLDDSDENFKPVFSDSYN